MLTSRSEATRSIASPWVSLKREPRTATAPPASGERRQQPIDHVLVNQGIVVQ